MPIKRRPRTIFVPPGGFLGFAQQTVATQALVQGAGKTRRKAPTRRRRAATRKRPVKKRVRRSPPPGKKRAAPKRRARLVKGSAAAKRHMAKLRRMRKK